MFWILKILFSTRGPRKKKYYRTPKPLYSKTKSYTQQALSEYEIREKIPNLPRAKIITVTDGDTVIVKKNGSNISIRLDSIDCPENGQYWGDTAKYGLIKLIGGKTISLEEHGIDNYGRTLATLYIWNDVKKEWLNINERMILLGHAWVMRQFYDHLPLERKSKLNSLERWAKSKKIGLWHQKNLSHLGNGERINLKYNKYIRNELS